MKLVASTLVLALFAACGGDEPPPPPKPGAPAGKPGAKPAGPAGKKVLLQARTHVEEKVTCPPPDKPTGPKCDPAAPTCDPGKFCLTVGAGAFCEACPERDSIRHEFKDRDFVLDQTRDPFQSFIIIQKGLEEPTEKKEEGPCKRQDQFVATNYSYLDLKLVGIVAQGTQRKVLMMDSGNLGHIIRRGDCVGKEKAVVKDIGPGFVTFVIQPGEDDKTPNRQPTERSIQLHPKGLQVAPVQSDSNGSTTTAPVVTPPGTPPGTPVDTSAPPVVSP